MAECGAAVKTFYQGITMITWTGKGELSKKTGNEDESENKEPIKEHATGQAGRMEVR